MYRYIMVLNDGETFTNVAGCKILRVEDDDFEYIPSKHTVVISFHAPAEGGDGFDTENHGMIPENDITPVPRQYPE